MKTYTAEELNEILRKHKAWLFDEDGDKRADLTGAYLTGADLRNADLTGADLTGAYLTGADLRNADLTGAYLTGAYLTGADLTGAYLTGAYLRDADLTGAYLEGAYLTGAYLRGAYLTGADLTGADLTGAYLTGAYLRDAKNINYPIACPEEGDFIGWKKAKLAESGVQVIVKLLITGRRSSATGRKCRCDMAEVLEIANLEGTVKFEKAVSLRDRYFHYAVGETVKVDDFDEDRWNECAPGIHFFITRQEAADYM